MFIELFFSLVQLLNLSLEFLWTGFVLILADEPLLDKFDSLICRMATLKAFDHLVDPGLVNFLLEGVREPLRLDAGCILVLS